MDARDTSSAAAASVVVDDDGAMVTVTSGLAKEAASLFQNGRYAECVEVLSQILQKKADDLKVLHNIAIAEYYRSGCSDPKSLLDALKTLQKKREDLAHASIEELEISGIPHQMASDANNASYAADADTSLVTLNTAIILYHLHDYSHAESLLEPLYQKLHPLDETTALHVCLLLIDIALASNNASGAADVIQFMEKSFGDGYMVNQGDNGNALQHLPSSQSSKFSFPSSSLSAPDIISSDSRVSENPLDRMLSEDAIEYETLISTLDNSSQGLIRSMPNDHSTFPINRPVPSTDLKLKIHLYKVKLLLLTRNLKAAKREVKLGMNGRDSSIALLLKSQLEYARGNHRKAIKLLTTISNTDPGFSTILNNNLGCIYHQLQKYHTSIVLFAKAMKSSTSLLKQGGEKPLKLLTFSQDKSPFISYNCGLQFLMCGKPLTASRCFHAATPTLINKPLQWLRLAECCLMEVSGSNSRKFCYWAGSIAVHVIGSGKWRQLAVEMGSRDGHVEPTGVGNCYTLSLPFARHCLQNALMLLNRLDVKSTTAHLVHEEKTNDDRAPQGDLESDSRENKTAIDSSVSVYEVLCRRENSMIKQAALADLAYVELTLNNPTRALSAAFELQKLPGCSRIYSFFSRIYAAEALCRLNRPREAGDQISVYISEGNEVDFPYSEEDRLKWMGDNPNNEDSSSNGPSSIKNQADPHESKFDYFIGPEEACEAIFINLGVLSAIQGDLDQSRQFLRKALLANPNNPQALAVAAYMDLREGATSDAISKLKQCGRVRFLPNGISSKGSR